jgi:hypothetical protein
LKKGNFALRTKSFRLTALVGACLTMALTGIARANTITVDSLAGFSDPPHCSLSDATTAANTMTAVNGCAAGSGNDVINFKVSGVIDVVVIPEIKNTLTINAPTGGITLDGSFAIALMSVDQGAVGTINGITFTNIQNGTETEEAFVNGGTATLNNCTFAHNHSGAENASSGAIFNFDEATGPLIITNSTFVDNSGPSGGAIDNQSAMTIVNSTFYGNRFTDIDTLQQNVHLPASAVIINSTFGGLSGPDGYSIGSFGGASTTLKGVILATDQVNFEDCASSATIVDGGYNISSDKYLSVQRDQ